jgi:hypothetical protein
VKPDEALIRQAIRGALTDLGLFEQGQLGLKRREVELLIGLTKFADEVEAKIVSRKFQKESVATKRRHLSLRNERIGDFYIDQIRANPKYSIPQLRRDLKKKRGKFREQLRHGGKFLSVTQLDTIVKEYVAFFYGQNASQIAPNR